MSGYFSRLIARSSGRSPSIRPLNSRPAPPLIAEHIQEVSAGTAIFGSPSPVPQPTASPRATDRIETNETRPNEPVPYVSHSASPQQQHSDFPPELHESGEQYALETRGDETPPTLPQYIELPNPASQPRASRQGPTSPTERIWPPAWPEPNSDAASPAPLAPRPLLRPTPLVADPMHQEYVAPLNIARPNLKSTQHTPAPASREPTEIHINIGRIEVTALGPAETKRAAPPPRRATSLEDYLARRQKDQL